MMIPFAHYPDFPQFDPGDRVNGVRVTALRGRGSTVQSQGDRANLTPTKSDGAIFRFLMISRQCYGI